MLTRKRGAVLALGTLGFLAVNPAEAQIGKMWENMTNPKTTIQIEHPPALPLRVKRVAFGETKGGACADSLQSRVLEDFFANNVEVVDRSQLDALIAEHRLQGSALFDQKNATEVGRLLGAEALIFIDMHACKAENTRTAYSCVVNKVQQTCYKYNTSAVQRGQLRTIDLTTGRLLAAKGFDAHVTESAEGGYPPSDMVLQRSEAWAAGQIRKLFFPWTETKDLIFYDDKDCGLKSAHALLRAQDFPGALELSVQNLESCQSLGAAKPKLLAHAYYNLGMVNFIMGSFDQGVENLTAAAKLSASETITTALAECRTAQKTAQEMARYETDQAAFLAEMAASEASPEPAKPAARATAAAKTPAKSGAAPAAPAPGGKGSPEERLQKLENLFKKNLISKTEYESMRASILSEL